MNIRDPRTQKIMFGALLLGGLFVSFFALPALPFGYRAKAAEIEQLKEEYAKLSSQVNQARRLASDLPRIEARYKATQDKWELAHELLPAETEMASFLRHVTIVGNSSGVDFVEVEPENSKNLKFYAENPVKLKVIGGYHEVGTFLGEVAKLPRLVNVGLIELKAVEGGEDKETLTASFVASAYSVTGSHVRAKTGSVPPRVGEEEPKDTAPKPPRRKRAGHGSHKQKKSEE